MSEYEPKTLFGKLVAQAVADDQGEAYAEFKSEYDSYGRIAEAVLAKMQTDPKPRRASPPTTRAGEVRMDNWQDISTAPKGGGSMSVTDPHWVDPPALLVYCANGDMQIARWDWYYAEGGRGYDGSSAWVTDIGGERVDPTHWMAPPTPPTQTPGK